MALACVGASAQVETTPVKLSCGEIYGIPESFVYGNDMTPLVFVLGDYQNVKGFSVYDEELNLVKEINVIEQPIQFGFYDMRSWTDMNPVILTQTLFNDDEKYEYVVEISEDGDNYNGMSGIKIVSEDGEVLQTVNFDILEYSYVYIVKVGECVYLAFESVGSGDNLYLDLYKINKSANDPTKVSVAVSPTRISVSPRVAERSQDITVVVEGEGLREVVVTDAAGRIVYKTKAAAGQQTVKINSHKLSSGLNVVSVKGADGKSENCKVIVKK